MPLDLEFIFMSEGSKTQAWMRWRVLKWPFSGFRFTFQKKISVDDVVSGNHWSA
jgi:hypothetical protein